MPTPLNNSVLKAFEILSLFAKSRPEISSAVLVEQLGLNNATAHRFLMTLEAAGAVRATKRGYFALGPKIDELGQVSEETGAIGILVQPQLDSLSRTLNESIMLSKLSKSGPTCVAVANSTRAISVNITVGTVLPFISSAQGKLWLSEMDAQTRRGYLENSVIVGTNLDPMRIETLEEELKAIADAGYATNLGENEPDIAAVCVPVRRPDGQMVHSLSTFGLLRRFDDRFIRLARERLVASADQIGQLLS